MDEDLTLSGTATRMDGERVQGWMGNGCRDGWGTGAGMDGEQVQGWKGNR